MNIRRVTSFIIAGALLTANFTPPALAQESGEDELNKCVEKQQLKATLKGAGAGLIGGLLAPADDKDKLKNTAIATAAGAASGFALAYFTANEKCLRKNPHLQKVPEIETDSDLAKAYEELSYDPKKKKVALKASKLTIVEGKSKGGNITVTAEFIALTPDSAEIPITWTIDSYIVYDGGEEKKVDAEWYKNTALIVPSGRTKIIQHLPFPEPKDGPVTYRFEFTVETSGHNKVDKAAYRSETETRFILK